MEEVCKIVEEIVKLAEHCKIVEEIVKSWRLCVVKSCSQHVSDNSGGFGPPYGTPLN